MSTPAYKKEKYDRIGLFVRKGKREEYQQMAGEFGITLSMLVQCGVEEFIQRHAGEVNSPAQPAPVTPVTQVTQPAEQISANQRRLLEAVNRLPADAQKSLLKFLQLLSKAENTAKNASVDAQEPI